MLWSLQGANNEGNVASSNLANCITWLRLASPSRSQLEGRASRFCTMLLECFLLFTIMAHSICLCLSQAGPHKPCKAPTLLLPLICTRLPLPSRHLCCSDSHLAKHKGFVLMCKVNDDMISGAKSASADKVGTVQAEFARGRHIC